jgi:hypothetical protein
LNPAAERRGTEQTKLILVVLVANAELARVAVTVVALRDAEQDIVPPLHFDDVLSFIRRRGASNAANDDDSAARATGAGTSRR